MSGIKESGKVSAQQAYRWIIATLRAFAMPLARLRPVLERNGHLPSKAKPKGQGPRLLPSEIPFELWDEMEKHVQ